MRKYSKIVSRPVPQTEPLNERQVKNNAGGFVFAIDKWSRLDRFLILGSDSNTYYQKATDLTRENAKCVTECWDEDAFRAVRTIATVSALGRAPKNDPAIFALALGASHKDVKVRQIALGRLQDVCRTATHLFQFIQISKALGRGWGRTMKRAAAEWYNDKPVEAVAYQMIKYREREGYSHKRLLQTAHPAPGTDPARVELYKWAWGKDVDPEKMPALVTAHKIAMMPETTKKIRLQLIRDHRLPWEALPTECNTDPDYWAAQLPTVGLTALIRNLGNLTRIGLIKPLSKAENAICGRLNNEDELRKARVHPFNVLVALKTYQSGKGFRGGNSWVPSQSICAALDKAFYKAFKAVQPTGKRFLLGLDVSGSMSTSMQGTNVRCCEATAALALVTMNVEPRTYVHGFASTFVDLGIKATDSLEEATRKARLSNFGSTDCSLPMTYALAKEIPVDVFVVMTDNETYAGRVHPSIALQQYRNKINRDAKLIVVAMTSTGFSIADPADAGMMDVVGFDTSAPSVMTDFARR